MAGREDIPQEILGSAPPLRGSRECEGIARNCTTPGRPPSERTEAIWQCLCPWSRCPSQGKAAACHDWSCRRGLRTEVNLVGIQQVLLNLAGKAFEPAARRACPPLRSRSQIGERWPSFSRDDGQHSAALRDRCMSTLRSKHGRRKGSPCTSAGAS